jgi:hypothetical protein
LPLSESVTALTVGDSEAPLFFANISLSQLVSIITN